jgi:hypothetical protein
VRAAPKVVIFAVLYNLNGGAVFKENNGEDVLEI